MFTRFVVPVWREDCRAEGGIFHYAYYVRGLRTAEPWLRQEIARELHWFGNELGVPTTFYRRVGRHGDLGGICWFRAEAGEHITRARYMGWLMGEAGVPVGEVRSHRPGPVLWEDDHQVVALANAGPERVFH